jgi:hypothetical protein
MTRYFGKFGKQWLFCVEKKYVFATQKKTAWCCSLLSCSWNANCNRSQKKFVFRMYSNDLFLWSAPKAVAVIKTSTL